MFKLALLITLFFLCACGKGGSPSPAPTPSPVIHLPDGSVLISLEARLDEPGDTQRNAVAITDSALVISPPNTLYTVLNGSEQGRATLTMGSVALYYQWSTPGVYSFTGCAGCMPGQAITLPSKSVITLMLQQGYVTQNTGIDLTLTGQKPN